MKIKHSKITLRSKSTRMLSDCAPEQRACVNSGNGGGNGTGECVPSKSSTTFQEQVKKEGIVQVSMRVCSSLGSMPQPGNTAERIVYTNAPSGSSGCCIGSGPGLPSQERLRGPTSETRIGDCMKLCFSTGSEGGGGGGGGEECCCQELLQNLLSKHLAISAAASYSE